MKWDHLIKNGKIVTPEATYGAHVYIKGGKIAAISQELLEGEAKKTTDAEGLHILPGLIDTHVHSRDGGSTYKEDFFHSTKAAAAGGITTIFEMPNTNPPVNNAENFQAQLENLSAKAHVDFGMWGICLGDLNIGDLEDLNDAGVIGFKYFWGYAVDKNNYRLIYDYKEGMEDVIPPSDDGGVYRMMEAVAKTGKTFAIHAENSDLINHLTNEMKETGKSDYATVLAGRPSLAEEMTIQAGIAMAKQTGTRLHVLHVSSKEGTEAIKLAQEQGYPITAETCPHYLFLTNEDYETIGPSMKVYPLVKYQEDQDRLWQGIEDGTFSLVCSDHAPHTQEEKQGDLWSVPAGMCGVESLAPLMLNAVSEGRISLQQVAALLSENPAKQFGVYPQKGSLQPGSDADFTIVDMDKQMTIKRENLHSKSKVTAYDGFQIKGVPVATIVRGTTVMKDGEILTGPVGTLVKPL
ncbi:allantoinase AllB [Planomicrobium sp. YIM 101495]|uniref:allantoinase AllB n=1 Tax=Planomicrobium sp. YIM 101495 TaxID=2665160 RepID=UPI0012B8172C|nr:allantoinase AllB [Planomicrobium sp. YIM 101495]MTD30703.1 allantoinase AllB [Planomicrobium sp. YIM 101495]